MKNTPSLPGSSRMQMPMTGNGGIKKVSQSKKVTNRVMSMAKSGSMPSKTSCYKK